MSNLIYNGDFQSPLITNGTDLPFLNMTSLEASRFYWIGDSFTSLNRGIGTYGYPSPPTGVSSQYVIFQYNSSLFQPINISKRGKYALTLFHCKRPTYNVFGLDILLDDVLISTIPSTIGQTWSSFRVEFTILRTGTQILKFTQPIDTENELAITNVSLVALDILDGCGAVYLPPLGFEKNKLFNIEDYHYQEKPISFRSGDSRYLMNNTNINHNGDLYVDGNDDVFTGNQLADAFNGF